MTMFDKTNVSPKVITPYSPSVTFKARPSNNALVGVCQGGGPGEGGQKNLGTYD